MVELGKSVAEIEAQHLDAAFYPKHELSTPTDDALPYHQLGGPGLERLCYLLLLAQGHVPRYFGKPGQKQYGIDLLVTHGDETTVYQCKNVKSFPLSKMKKALQRFKSEWLVARPELPTPAKFVLCCPLPLQERRQNEKWTTLEREFQAGTGVSVTFWDRNYLDERLRNLPDVVADLFSDRAAEQFCNLYDWNSDIFRPLVVGSGERNVERYLEQLEANRLYLDPKIEQTFTRKLDSSNSLLIQGLPGSGKTITGLALAQSYQQGRYRIFYVNLRHDLNENSLVQGVKRRLTHFTIFFFDDCHGKYELLDRVQSRLRPILAQRPRRGLLIFTARTTPTREGIKGEDLSDFERDLKANNAIQKFQPTLHLFRQIITQTQPHFAGLSEPRLEKIFEFTGHDFFLLDQLLYTLNSPGDVDHLEPQKLFEGTLRRYFDKQAVYRPTFKKLAALAQFDLAPPARYFNLALEREDEKAADQLVVLAGQRPPRYYFLHSSAAELIFRALAWNDQDDDHSALAAAYLIEFFRDCRMHDQQMAESLANVLQNQLKLRREEEEMSLKSQFLADDAIYELVARVFKQLPLNVVAACLRILQGRNEPALARYYDLVQRKIADDTVLEMIISTPVKETHRFLYLIKEHYQDIQSALESQFASRELCSLVQTATFNHVLLLLANLCQPGEPRWAAELDSIPGHEFDKMIERTLDYGRLIDTLGIGLRGLGKANPNLLEKLEQKIGAERYLRLIVATGTIPDLLKVIENSSSSMVEELIQALDAETLDALIDRTIDAGRSIGTINLSLRKLKEANLNWLKEIERKISAERLLRLIVATGTISELLRVIQYSSPSMVEKLTQALDAETLDVLIDQTIASGRSIGTINLALRELKKTDRAFRKTGAKNRHRTMVASHLRQGHCTNFERHFT